MVTSYITVVWLILLSEQKSFVIANFRKNSIFVIGLEFNFFQPPPPAENVNTDSEFPFDPIDKFFLSFFFHIVQN